MGERFTLRQAFRLFTEEFGLHALVAYRLGRWIASVQAKPLCWPVLVLLYPVFRGLTFWTRWAYGINLAEDARIGPGLCIGHFGGIRVSQCTIGTHCSIHQQVQILPKDSSGAGHGPIIGSNVWIGAHARIHGAVHIGDGATIGAGAVVECDVPARALVLGNPGRVTQRVFDNSEML